MPNRKASQLERLGPFVGGMDVRSGQFTSQLDARRDLRWIKNLDVTPEGLKQRRGWRYVPQTTGDLYTAPLTRFDLLGSGLVAGAIAGIVGKVTGAASTTVYIATTPTSSAGYSKITYNAGVLGNEFCACIFYNDNRWFVPRHNALPGSNSYKIPDLGSSSGVTVHTTIPPGNKAFIWKDRLWVFDYDSSTFYWSKSTDPSIFAAPDGGFVKIPGETPFTDAFVDGDTLYLFKRNAWYQFNFVADPATDGQLREMSTSVGSYVSTIHNDSVYIVNAEGVHEFVNGNFINISEKINVDLRAAEAWPLVLSVSNNMLIISSTDGQRRLGALFDSWAMNLDTGAWCMYDFGSVPLKLGPVSKSIPCYDGAVRRNLYGDGTTFLQYSVEQPWVTGFESASYDYKDDLHYYSPEYSLITFALNFEDSTALKKVKSIEVLGYSNLLDADSDIEWRLKLNDESAVQTADLSVFTNQIVSVTTDKVGVPERIPFPQFRCRLLAFDVSKRSADVGTVLPVDCFFQVYSFDVSYLGMDSQSIKPVT